MNGIMRCDKKYRWVLVATALTACALDAAQLSPKGSEWEDCQALGLGKLPPRAWFGHFPDTESAKGILMQTSPWPYIPSEHEYRLLAFAGIHQMHTSLLPLMQGYPDKFSIVDFYLQHCHDHVIRGYVQPGLRLMDVGKIETLGQADAFANSLNSH